MLTVEREAASTRAVTSRSGRRARPVAVGVGTLALTAYVAAVDPNRPGHYPVCPTYALAGVYCPGCGMLRATHDLTHGDVVGALQRNPLAPLVLAGMVALYVVWVVSRWTGRPVRWTPGRWTPWLVLAGFALFAVARNVPGWTWLSPA